MSGELFEKEIKDILILYENYFEKQDIENLMQYYSMDFISCMGTNEQVKHYYENFWFTLFEDLDMNITNIKIRKTGELIAVTCHISIRGLYIGKDMETLNKNYILGNVYEEKGKYQFLFEKEGGHWKIIN